MRSAAQLPFSFVPLTGGPSGLVLLLPAVKPCACARALLVVAACPVPSSTCSPAVTHELPEPSPPTALPLRLYIAPGFPLTPFLSRVRAHPKNRRLPSSAPDATPPRASRSRLDPASGFPSPPRSRCARRPPPRVAASLAPHKPVETPPSSPSPAAPPRAASGALQPDSSRLEHRAATTSPPRPPAEPLRRRSEEHTSELQSQCCISYAVFCLKKNAPND